jgi:hypothetical protein
MPLTAPGRTATRVDWAGHMDVSRETAAGHTAERAAAAGGMVLLTLASAQFLMTLDSSVMNVSIVTVAEDLGTTVTGIQTGITLYTLVIGLPHDQGRQGRPDSWPQACLRHRMRHLRLPVADHRAGTESGGADAGMVGAGRGGGGADHARDRRAGRVELRA